MAKFNVSDLVRFEDGSGDDAISYQGRVIEVLAGGRYTVQTGIGAGDIWTVTGDKLRKVLDPIDTAAGESFIVQLTIYSDQLNENGQIMADTVASLDLPPHLHVRAASAWRMWEHQVDAVKTEADPF